MSGFTSSLNWSLVCYRLTVQRWDIMAGLKERKKVLLLCALLMVRSRTVLVISVLLEVYAVHCINSFVFILLDVTF